jgi:hypothetical protein
MRNANNNSRRKIPTNNSRGGLGGKNSGLAQLPSGITGQTGSRKGLAGDSA